MENFKKTIEEKNTETISVNAPIDKTLHENLRTISEELGWKMTYVYQVALQKFAEDYARAKAEGEKARAETFEPRAPLDLSGTGIQEI